MASTVAISALPPVLGDRLKSSKADLEFSEASAARTPWFAPKTIVLAH